MLAVGLRPEVSPEDRVLVAVARLDRRRKRYRAAPTDDFERPRRRHRR